jgi:DNA mismatch repair protein MutL
MSDIIRLLPDSVANQIAAGEVVQRPASAVKELLENAVDAGATKIHLIIKDAGRTLIQVTDNGKGMSFQDARMSFERHATSKIQSADDLFHISTKGFRGEALASIAAIAQVEMKTKQSENETGTLLLIEGSTVKEHSPAATQDGTSIAVKNLFFNVPARRNFLKSDAVEFGHIEEEFYRVSLIHPEIAFSLTHNGKTVLQLHDSNFKQRIINIFGNHFNGKLFPVELDTDQVKISGYIAKPENSKKGKSEQYMFVNNRYVKHSLLNFAIEKAYTELIPEKHKPPYFIHIEVDPATIDINISPTKVDVKLQDERLIFGFLNSCVKKSLGSMSLIPQIDFEIDKSRDFDMMKPNSHVLIPPSTGVNPNYNPFEQKSSGHYTSSNFPKTGSGKMEGWEDFMKGIKTVNMGDVGDTVPAQMEFPEILPAEQKMQPDEKLHYIIIENQYLLYKLDKNLAIVDILNARERILYEYFKEALEQQPVVIQQSLFPETVVFSAGNAEMLCELKDELFKLGYDIEPMSNNQFAVNGTPQNEDGEDTQQILESFIETYKSNAFLHRKEKEDTVALSMAKQKRSRFTPFCDETEVRHFLQQLLDCTIPHTSPSNQKVIHIMNSETIKQFFK